jgi:hypothetical protein
MRLTLAEIPGLELDPQAIWKVRALVFGYPEGDRNPTLAALERWNRKYPLAYKTIIKVMKIAALKKRVHNPKHVKQSSNPKHGEVYEMMAYKDVPRLFFFYEEGSENLIICTNEFEKSGGDQDAAFARCACFRDLYRNQKNEQKYTSRRPTR